MATQIPESHRYLIEGSYCVGLTTMMPDGQPQSSIVWADCDGRYVLINTTCERQKGRNLRAHPKVTLLIVDPNNVSRWIEVRGSVVEFTEDGAEAHADKLTRQYTGKRRFYGDIYPAEQKQRETRVIVRIEPIKVSLDAIFKRLATAIATVNNDEVERATAHRVSGSGRDDRL